MSSVSGTNNTDLWGVGAPVNLNAVYDNSGTTLEIEDFLQLMIAEMTNMDFMGGSDGSSGGSNTADYITQLAQMSTMQQMEQLAYYSKTNYMMGLIGQEVTVADYSIGGSVKSETGIVEKVTLSGDEPMVYVNGTAYSASKIMSVNSAAATAKDEMEAAERLTPYLRKRGEDYATIAWDAPEAADISKYSFSIYYSTEQAMNTVAEIKQNGTLADSMEGSSDMHTELTDLEPGMTYYVNIIMSSDDGTEKAYQKLIFETKEA